MTDWQNPDLNEKQHLTILGLGASSPEYWAEVVALQRKRVRRHQLNLQRHLNVFPTLATPMAGFDAFQKSYRLLWALGADAHFLVYAADHVQTICEHYKSLSKSDPRVSEAFDSFVGAVPDLSMLRDFLAHFEEYALGSGRKAKGTQFTGPELAFEDASNLTGEITISVGEYRVHIYRLADEVERLVRKLKPIWWELIGPSPMSSIT